MKNTKSSDKNKKQERLLNLIAKTVNEVDGVSCLASYRNENWAKPFIKPSNVRNCIKLFQETEQEGFILDIYINIKNEYKIPDIAWDIQTKVKSKLKSLDLNVKNINVHIQGIDFIKIG